MAYVHQQMGVSRLEETVLRRWHRTSKSLQEWLVLRGTVRLNLLLGLLEHQAERFDPSLPNVIMLRRHFKRSIHCAHLWLLVRRLRRPHIMAERSADVWIR